MATAHRIDYSALDDEWVVDEEAGVYPSPSREGHQWPIFNEPFRDGTISAGITVREGRPLDDGWMSREGSIAFRH